MKLLRRFPLVAFATVLLGIAAFCVAYQSVGLLLVAGVLAALSWQVTEGPRGRSLPQWAANVLLVAVVLNVIVDMAQNPADLLGALGRLCLWLTLIKLYQRKTPRDHAQLLGLSVIMILLGAVHSGDLLFAVVCILYAIAGIQAVVLFRLYAAHEATRRARAESSPEGGRLTASLEPVFGRHLHGQFRALVGVIGAGGIVVATLVFLVFPREYGLDPVTGIGAGRRTGFADEINLTGASRITSSRVLVMIARGYPGPGKSGQPLRLRGAVLDRYEGGGRWRVQPSNVRWFGRTDPPGFTLLSDGSGEIEGTADLDFEVLVPQPTIFSVYAPVALSTADARDFIYDPRSQTIEYADTDRLRHYTVRIAPEPTDADLKRLVRGREPSEPVMAWTPPERVHELARQWLAEGGVPAVPPDDPLERWSWNLAAAQALARPFHAGQFEYDTDLRDLTLPAPDRDPIVQFLFETRRGHCEFFASALAALCDSVGIPARLVTGYVTLEFDPGDETYLVRESNAHAWVEVRTGPYRWRAVDPTPPGMLRALHTPPLSGTARFRAWLARLEASWRNEFIAFDRRAQQRVLGAFDPRLEERIPRAVESVAAWMRRVNRSFYFGPAGYIWMGIVATALVIAIIAVARSLRRGARLRSALHLAHLHGLEYQRMLRQLGFYMDMLGVLERHGLPKPAWQPPLAYARRMAGERPGPAKIVGELTELYYEARYGRRPLDRESQQRARALLEELARALGGRVA